jgi:hypothetical protein
MSRWKCAIAISLGLLPVTIDTGEAGTLHRVSCTVVRFYVAKYSAAAAEQWARSKGATDAEIDVARHCLKPEGTLTAAAFKPDR